MTHSVFWWRRVAGGCLLLAWHAGCGGGGAPAAPSPGGRSRETGNLVTPRRCGYHDHEQPANAVLRGAIVIQ